MSKCEYCHTDRDGYIKPLDKNAHVYLWLSGVYSNNLHIKLYGREMHLPINYCPICGRDLKIKETVEIKH